MINLQKQDFKGILFTIMPDKQEENRNNRGQSVKSTVFTRHNHLRNSGDKQTTHQLKWVACSIAGSSQAI